MIGTSTPNVRSVSTIFGTALAASSVLTVTRTSSEPARANSITWFTVAVVSAVSVLVIDWTTTGWAPPTLTAPTLTTTDLRRGDAGMNCNFSSERGNSLFYQAMRGMLVLWPETRPYRYTSDGDPSLNLRGFLRLFTHIQLLPILESGEETTLVGGQAVMEGVMMRSPHSYCVAVRKASGEIVTEEKPLAKLSDRHPAFKLPVLRGVGTLCQAMWLGLKALHFSANNLVEDLDGDKTPKKNKKEMSSWAMWANV